VGLAAAAAAVANLLTQQQRVFSRWPAVAFDALLPPPLSYGRPLDLYSLWLPPRLSLLDRIVTYLS
jgi:hypothetical protein